MKKKIISIFALLVSAFTWSSDQLVENSSLSISAVQNHLQTGRVSLSSPKSIYLDINENGALQGSFRLNRGKSEKPIVEIKEINFQDCKRPHAQCTKKPSSDERANVTRLKMYGTWYPHPSYHNKGNALRSSTMFYYSGEDLSSHRKKAGVNYAHVPFNKGDNYRFREELAIMAGSDMVGADNNSAGVHYYGGTTLSMLAG